MDIAKVNFRPAYCPGCGERLEDAFDTEKFDEGKPIKCRACGTVIVKDEEEDGEEANGS